MPQVEFWPETLQEENMRIFMALPQHEITQAHDATGSHKYIQWWTTLCVHVAIQGLCCDCFLVPEPRGFRLRLLGHLAWRVWVQCRVRRDRFICI